MIVTCIGVDVFQIMKLYGFKLVDTNWLFEWYMIMTDYTHKLGLDINEVSRKKATLSNLSLPIYYQFYHLPYLISLDFR